MKTKLTDNELKTIEYYDVYSQEWSQKHSCGRLFNEDMGELFKLVPSGKILEIGVGSGKDALSLIRHYGLKNYVGIEPAKGLLKIARKNNPGINILDEDIFGMNFPSNNFDAFWVCAMLIHIPKNNLLKALKKIKDCLKKGSHGFISVMEGNQDMVESRPGRYYSLWSQEEFEKELSKAGFDVFRKRRIVPENSSPWLAYILKIND